PGTRIPPSPAQKSTGPVVSLVSCPSLVPVSSLVPVVVAPLLVVASALVPVVASPLELDVASPLAPPGVGASSPELELLDGPDEPVEPFAVAPPLRPVPASPLSAPTPPQPTNAAAIAQLAPRIVMTGTLPKAAAPREREAVWATPPNCDDGGRVHGRLAR